MRVCILWLVIALFADSAFGNTVFTYRAPESDLDVRYDYDYELLLLALEKTKKTFGEYELRASPRMNFPRAQLSARANTLPNFFFKDSYKQELTDELTYAPFPVDLGIVGYRACFVSKTNKYKLESIKGIEDLKKLTYGFGLGWLDTIILRHHGFIVHEIPSYEGLFKMVEMNRVDLFCRGANELLGEYNAHKDFKNLTYDKHISLAYPLPRFFFTSKQNKAAAERVFKGLEIAYHDGSLKKLWLKYYEDSINFVNLHKRKIFHLTNPMLKGIDKRYEQYIYNPLKGSDTATVTP